MLSGVLWVLLRIIKTEGILGKPELVSEARRVFQDGVPSKPSWPKTPAEETHTPMGVASEWASLLSTGGKEPFHQPCVPSGVTS